MIFKAFISLSLSFRTLFCIFLSLIKVQRHQIDNYFPILKALYLNYYLRMANFDLIVFLEFGLFKKNKYFMFVQILSVFKCNYYLAVYILIFHLFFFVFKVDPSIFSLMALILFMLFVFLIQERI